MAHRIPKGLFKRHTCQRSTVIGTPKSIPELNEEHTCPPINHNSCLRLGFCFCFLSYPFFSFFGSRSSTFFDKCRTPRVKCVPSSRKGKLSHFLGILWCSILPRIWRYRAPAAGRGAASVLAAAFGACHCPKAIFCCSPLCRAMPARGRGVPRTAADFILLFFFPFTRQGKPLIYAALGRF